MDNIAKVQQWNGKRGAYVNLKDMVLKPCQFN